MAVVPTRSVRPTDWRSWNSFVSIERKYLGIKTTIYKLVSSLQYIIVVQYTVHQISSKKYKSTGTGYTVTLCIAIFRGANVFSYLFFRPTDNFRVAISTLALAMKRSKSFDWSSEPIEADLQWMAPEWTHKLMVCQQQQKKRSTISQHSTLAYSPLHPIRIRWQSWFSTSRAPSHVDWQMWQSHKQRGQYNQCMRVCLPAHPAWWTFYPNLAFSVNKFLFSFDVWFFH